MQDMVVFPTIVVCHLWTKSDCPGKDVVFPHIKLNAYDYNDNSGKLEFNVVFNETKIAYFLAFSATTILPRVGGRNFLLNRELN